MTAADTGDNDAIADEQGPMVSVIIPTYNRANLLAEAIDSVIGQTYPRLEIIVVDDGSTDETRTMLSAYGSRIKSVFLPHSGLAARARNAGIRAAQGEYLAFLDSDDRWLPDKTHKQLAAFAANPAAGLVCANAEVIDAQGRATGELFHPGDRINQKSHTFCGLVQKNRLITSTVMCKSEIVRMTGGFCESPVLRTGQDYDFWLRCAALAPVVYLNESLADYRKGQAGRITGSDGAFAQRRGAAWLLVHDRIIHYLKTETTRRVPHYALARLKLGAYKRLLEAARADKRHAQALRLRLQILSLRLRLPMTILFYGKE